jgi:RHS repeat-associated protein
MSDNDSEDTRQVEKAEGEELNRIANEIKNIPLSAAPELGRQYTVLFANDWLNALQNQDDRTTLEQAIVDSLADRGEAYRGIIHDTLDALAQPGSIGVGYLPDPNAVNQATGADPVQMFNGEFTHDAVDMHINGAGIDFVFHRMYRNQVVFSGPLGANWDHGYNLHLQAFDTELILTTGELREQRYTRHPLFNYFVPPDGVDAIFETFGESFVRRAPNGTRHIFAPDPSLSTFHRLARIEDRFGNFLQFVYQEDERGLLDQVLVNHLTRVIQFHYDTQGRITDITDYIGRTWRYAYDDLNDLVAVTSPTTDSYPHGLTTCYEYRTAFASGLAQHNLTHIIDAAGQLYLENEYGESPGDINFNRVIRQRQGSGETTFEYEDVAPVFERDYSDAQRPAHQTTMMDRNGHLSHHIYNKFGNLLFEEERIIENGIPQIIFKRYRYNRDGQLTASLSPMGVLTQQLYGREFFMRRNNITDEDEISAHENLTPQERQGFGRLLTTLRRGRQLGFQELNLAQGVWGDFPDIIGGFEPDGRDIVVKFTYEPIYGQLLTASDPRFTSSPDPTIQTTAAGENPNYDKTLTRYIYRGPADNPNGDPTRLLVEIQRPKLTHSDGTVGDPVVERFEAYDEQGRLLRHVNPVGAVTLNSYFDDNDERDGYLQRTIIDPNGLAITTEYETDTLGRTIAVHLPRSVEASDDRFIMHTEYNNLDQVVETTSSKPSQFKIRHFYDRNGKLKREELQVKDESGNETLGGIQVHTYCYDEEFNLVRETIGGIDLSAHLVTHHCYDTAGPRTLTILPNGNQVHYSYDERMLPVAKTLGSGSDEAATTRTEYDADVRVRRTFDARGNATTFMLDPFGRVIAEEDALGQITRRDYDKLGNVICTRAFERQADDTYRLLSRSETLYDELGRAIRSGVNRFDELLEPVRKETLDNAFLPSPGPGELLVTQTFYDSQGRVRRTVDPLMRVSMFEYDALDRLIVQTDPLGNRIENHYDAHGNLVRRDQIDLVRENGTRRVFSSSSTYDELDRIISSADSLGNITRYFYDSRGNQVKRIDPLGNVVHSDYDIFNRRIATHQELTDNGLGSGAVLATATTTYEYDQNGNLMVVGDALGRRTRYLFDALDRRRAIVYPDESQMRFDYDRDGHLIRTVDNNGLERRYTVDVLGRTTRVDVDKSGLPSDLVVEGATFEHYEYDGLDRQYRAENDFARSDIRFNSLGWPLAETVTFTTLDAPLTTPLVMEREFSNVGALIGLTYPNGRQLNFQRDNLNRLTQVQNLAKGTDYPGNSATPDMHDIATMEYAGRHRIRCTFGNGAGTRYSHDSAGRIIEIAHTSSTAQLLTIQYLFDAFGNVRVRHDISPTRNVAETFAYDSFYRLVNETTENRGAFDPALLAPFTIVPSGSIPDRQVELDNLIGPLALPLGIKTFDYDLVGNRNREQLKDDLSVEYVPNELDQYKTRNTTAFSYDPNGNLKSDDQHIYTYDSMNRLVRATDLSTGETIALFFHDAYGQRILEVQGSTATHLIWDGDDQVAEYRNGMPFAFYVFDDGVDRPLQITVESNEHWYHADLAGSVRLLTDQIGAELASYHYNSFGVLQEDSDSGPYNPWHYTARRLNDALETYDYRTRQYNPKLGRFQQRDMAGTVDGMNLFAYSGNNPLAYADPSGAGREERIHESTPKNSLERMHQQYLGLPEEKRYAYAKTYGRLLGYSGIEVQEGKEIDIYDRISGHYQRVANYYNIKDLEKAPDYLLDLVAPSTPGPHDNYFLRYGEDLDTIHRTITRHPLDPLSRRFREKLAQASPIVAPLYEPNTGVSIPVTGKTIWGVRLDRGDAEVVASLGGGIGRQLGDWLGLDYEKSMALGRISQGVSQFLPSAGTAIARRIQLNRQNGNAFRDEVAEAIRQSGPGRDVRTEVYKRTAYGKRYMDIDVGILGETFRLNLGGVEAKVGSSRYGPWQRLKDQWLKINRGYPVNVIRKP